VSLNNPVRTGWASVLSRTTGAILLFELVSGLAITFGNLHPTIEWGLLLHTVLGVATLAPLAWYVVRHWQDYSDQALSDVLVLGYVGGGALVACLLSGAGLPHRLCSESAHHPGSAIPT
jgi:hypothetical protein